jgi:hypothetical protein
VIAARSSFARLSGRRPTTAAMLAPGSIRRGPAHGGPLPSWTKGSSRRQLARETGAAPGIAALLGGLLGAGGDAFAMKSDSSTTDSADAGFRVGRQGAATLGSSFAWMQQCSVAFATGELRHPRRRRKAATTRERSSRPSPLLIVRTSSEMGDCAGCCSRGGKRAPRPAVGDTGGAR